MQLGSITKIQKHFDSAPLKKDTCYTHDDGFPGRRHYSHRRVLHFTATDTARGYQSQEEWDIDQRSPPPPRRLRKVLESKLNDKNIVNAIKFKAVPVSRFSAGIVE